jgi:hypothetical protein
MAEVIQAVEIKYEFPGADRVAAGFKNVEGAAGRAGAATKDYTATILLAEAAQARALATSTRSVETRNREVEINRKIAAANDNLAHSYGAANDNSERASRSFLSTGAETLALAGHLKGLALAAYVVSPALRGVVNPAITAAVGSALPAAFSAAGASIKALSPYLSNAIAFLSRISLPILAIVAVWKALNAVIDTGTELLAKYGNAHRALDSADMAEALAKLTKLQPKDDGVTPSQAREAAVLNQRLEDAKFKMEEILKVQFNINDAALGLKNIWVSIIEKLVEYADKAAKLGPPDPGLENALSNAQKGILVPGDIPVSTKGDLDPAIAAMRERARLREEARLKINTVLSGKIGTAQDDHDEAIGPTFAARWNAAIELLSKGEDKAEKTKSAFDQLYASMQRSVAVQEAEARSVDGGVREHARLRTAMRLEESALQEIALTGKGTLDDYAERIKTLADRFGAAAQQAAELKLKSDIKFTGDTLFLSESEKHIASILRQTYGSEWKNMMNGPIAGAIRWNNTLKEIVDTTKEIGGEIMKSVVHALMEEKNVGEALSATLKNLSMRLADKTIESLLSGDFTKAAISGVSALATFIGSKLLDNSADKALDEAKKKFADMSDEVRSFNAAADGFELSQFVSAMQQITKTGLELIKTAMAAGDTASAVQLIFSGVKQINNQVDAFIRPKGNDVASQIANVNNEAQQIIGELNDLNAKYGLGLNRTAEILGAAAEHIAEIQRKAEEEINKRRLSFQDLAFNATNDPSTLEGALAAQARDFEKERIAEAAAGNEAVLDMVVSQQARELALRQSFADKAIEETKRQAQEQLDAQTRAAKGIVDYINNLKVGPDSSLSPTARLAAAQSTYNSVLALAQGGNVDALSRITQDAENFRKAAKDVYGSASPYQNILDAIVANLQGLPAVATSTDPVVQAVLGTTAAVEATRTAVLADTTATVAKLDTAIARFVDAVNLLSATVGRLDTANSILSALQGLQNTSTAQLQILAASNTATAFGTRDKPAGTPFENAPTVNVQNSMLSALNKIAFNTYAISFNTAQIVAAQAGSAPWKIGNFATGGIAQPGQSIIYGEHHPQGPFFGRVGSQPIAITPAMPSLPGAANDNGWQIVAELRRNHDALVRVLSAVGAAIVNAETKSGKEVADALVGALGSYTAAVKDEARHDRLNPTKKAA